MAKVDGMKKVTVLCAGTWGISLTILLAGNGHEVTLWSKFKEETDPLLADPTVIKNLPGAVFPEGVKITNDIAEAVEEDTDLIVMSSASTGVREVARVVAPYVKEGTVIVNASKGIENGTLYTMTEIISQEVPQAKVAVLSGPSHAEEVCRQIPTTVVVGAAVKETALFVQDIFMNKSFRVYTSPDVMGIELGGSLKNVIALAAGIIDGLEFGDNTKAALITRGIVEIARLGQAMGAQYETFAGLSGIGDLIVTCTSRHSRNHNAGYLLGKGVSLEAAKKEVGQVIEGVNSAQAALTLAQKYQIEMPIVEQVNEVLFHGKAAKDALADLLVRDRATEYSSLSWE